MRAIISLLVALAVLLPTAAFAHPGHGPELGLLTGFIHPLTGVADSHLTDRDLMIYALKAGYGRKGARIGSRDGDAEVFKTEMLAFWRRTLG